MSQKTNKVKIRDSLPKGWIVILAITILGAVAVLAVVLNKKTENPLLRTDAKINISQPRTMSAPTISQINKPRTQAFDSMLSELEEKDLMRAEQSGDSYVAPLRPSVMEEEKKTEEVESQVPQKEAKKEQPYVTNATMMAYMNGLSDRWSAFEPHTTTAVVMPETLLSGDPNVEVSAAQKTANTYSPLPIRPGEVLFVSNDIGVNSDRSIPRVQVTVVYGKTKGAVLTGKYERVRDFLVLSFSSIRLPDGREFNIESYAIDMQTKQLAVASDVDTHFFERWGGLIAASLIEGASDAITLGNTSSTTTTNTDGEQVVVETRDKLTGKEQFLVAASKVGERVAGIMESGFNRPPTVTLNGDILMAVKIIDIEAK